MHTFTFDQQVAVVTGGGSGLGQAFCREAARRGMSVVVADIQQDAIDRTTAQLRTVGVPVIGHRTDVSDAQSVAALKDAAVEAFGTVHLVFNNAGVTGGGLVWENAESDWHWLLGVNLHGVINGLRAFTPLMLDAARADRQYRGHIVNTASMAGLLAGVASGLYSVSKHAVLGLSEALYQDLALVTNQVGCSVLCPSYVPTAIGNSDRNRPAALAPADAPTPSQRLAREISSEAVDTGPVSATEVARMTFDAVAEGRFYIYTHPDTLTAVRNRFEHLLAQRNPPLGFEGNASRSARRTRLAEALSQAA